MTHDEVLKKLNQVFQDTFDDDSIIICDSTTAQDIDEWDSLMHITLVSEIESKFNIHFKMKDVINLRNVGEMVKKIMELL